MAQRVAPGGIPRHSDSNGDPLYFVSDVVTAIGLESLAGYDHMTKIMLLALDTAEVQVKTRDTSTKRLYSVADVAAARVAISLLRSQLSVPNGPFEFRTLKLEAAVRRLREVGFNRPLLDTDIRWDTRTRRYVVHIRGLLVDAASGQGRLDEVADDLARAVIDDVAAVQAVYSAAARAKNALPLEVQRKATLEVQGIGVPTRR
jgi:hypothetical protein